MRRAAPRPGRGRGPPRHQPEAEGDGEQRRAAHRETGDPALGGGSSGAPVLRHEDARDPDVLGDAGLDHALTAEQDPRAARLRWPRAAGRESPPAERSGLRPGPSTRTDVGACAGVPGLEPRYPHRDDAEGCAATAPPPRVPTPRAAVAASASTTGRSLRDPRASTVSYLDDHRRQLRRVATVMPAQTSPTWILAPLEGVLADRHMPSRGP